MTSLKDGDRVIGTAQLASDAQDLVFFTSHAQLLRFGALSVRPQGRAAGGMAGIRLSPRASVIWFGAVDPASPASPAGEVVTVVGRSGALPGTMAATVTESAYAEFPPQGRATGSSRARTRWCWPGPVLARRGGPPTRATSVELPPPTGRRDGSGERITQPLSVIGGSAPPA